MKIVKCLLSLLVVVNLGACSKNDTQNTDSETQSNANACGEDTTTCGFNNPADMDAYESFTNANQVFQKSDLPSILKVIEEKQSAIVYFGFATCPWCLEAVPVLDEAAKALNKKILYVETRDSERNPLIIDEDKTKFIGLANDYLDKDEEGNAQLYNPCVVIIKDGVVVGAHTGTLAEHDAKERKMSDDEIQQLKDIYLDLLNI